MEKNLKPLLILTRIIIVGLLWSVFFMEGIRVIMLQNWRFDIFRSSHWQHAWDLWMSGWVIDDPKEWAFVMIILTFIPLWLTGWAALSMISWGKLFLSAAMFPLKLFKNFFYKPVKIIANTTGIKTVKKKKSYKEVRPRSVRSPVDERSDLAPRPSMTGTVTASKAPLRRKPAIPAAKEDINKPGKAFDHSLFQFDNSDEDDFDFNFDAFDKLDDDKKVEPPVSENTNSGNDDRNRKNNNQNQRGNNRDKKNAPQQPKQAQSPAPAAGNKPVGNSSLEVIKQKGYEVITGATVKNNLIDFIGVADKQICLCLLDKEPGDWLADEERFNDEEPLWFSESSHRISPVRKADLSRKVLADKLKEMDLNFEVKAYVVEQIGNIINAEDMFEVWEDMGITVTRIDRGSPKELKLFSKTLEEAVDKIDKDKFEKLKKLIRNIA